MVLDFRKCGVISAAFNVDKNVYAFSCTFCAEEYCLPFFSFESFMQHIENQHSPEFDVGLGLKENDGGKLKDDRKVLEEIKNESFSALETEPTTDINFFGIMKESKLPPHSSTDPLDEPSSNSKPTEKTVEVKVESELNISDDEDDSLSGHLDSSNDNFKTDTNESEDSSIATDAEANETEILLNDKEITLSIIGCYEEQRLLWDESEPHARNRKKRKEAFKIISDRVKIEIGVRLKAENVRERIRRMRCKFRSQKLAKSKNPNYAPLWYFEKLQFLNESVKCNQRNKIAAKALAIENPSLPLSGLTHEQNLELIEIYKSKPCLWDVEHIGYRFQNQRQDALEDMLQTIKTKIDLELTEDELHEKINCIQFACTQEKDRKLKCEREKKDFVPNCKYYENISFLEEHVFPFKCPFCEILFNSNDTFKMHKYNHDGAMPFTCPICNRGFMGAGNYKVHLRRHTRDFPFECKECGKRFATSTDLKVHTRNHTGEKPYFCEFCGRTFRTWSYFDTHMRRHQKQPSRKCTICMRAFYENSSLKEHMLTHRNVRDKVCNVCNKAFTTAKYLRQHKQIHAEKKKYVCKICRKDFAQYAGLSGHMKSHGTTMSGSFAEENT